MPRPVSEKQLRYMAYVQREEGLRHQSTEDDLRTYELLKAGDMRAVDSMREIFATTISASKTSTDPLRNAKYLFVASVTLAGRAAMSVGMDTERSNIASDLFIQQADRMTSIEQIHELTLEMLRFYVLEVQALDKQKTYSRNVARALEYIYNHLHEPITVESVAEELHLSRGYFSTLFKQEMGIGVADYILKKRLEAARNMLRHSDMSSAEISEILAFSSQSHFIQVFKKHEGMTPNQFRQQAI